MAPTHPRDHQELKKTSADKAEAEQWKDTLKQATGEKVMDDQVKLKRAIKAREAQKKKATKKWGKIQKDVTKAKEEKQAKRTENLKKRNDPLYAKEAEKPAKKPPAEPTDTLEQGDHSQRCRARFN